MRRIKRVAVAFAALLVSAQAAGAVLIVTCRDGNPQAVVKAPGQPLQPVDWVTCDEVVDRTCNFAIERGGCGCVLKGCCGYIKVAVPVRHQRSVSLPDGTMFRL